MRSAPLYWAANYRKVLWQQTRSQSSVKLGNSFQGGIEKDVLLQATEGVFAACVLERPQVFIPELPAWESEYLEWKEQQSYRKQLPEEFETVGSASGSQGGTGGWEPASRRTTADETNDRKSLLRRLDSRLFLLIKPKGSLLSDISKWKMQQECSICTAIIGLTRGVLEAGSSTWGFPQQQHMAGEGISDTAKRAVEGLIGDKPQVFFFGRAPHAHIQQESGLLFLHRAQLIQGRPAFLPGSSISDHLWLAKDEVSDVVPDSNLSAILEKLL